MAVTTGGAGEDYAIANYTLREGEARVFGGLANGDFDTLLNLSLPNDGRRGVLQRSATVLPLENFGGNTQTISGASLTQQLRGQRHRCGHGDLHGSDP